MRYTKKTSIEEIRRTHEVVLGWGNSVVQFERFYNPALYQLDGLINGQSLHVGDIVCGQEVRTPSYVEKFRGKRVCFIIYPNIEEECIAQIRQLIPEADTIIGRLVDCGKPHREFYSSDEEDLIFLRLLHELGITDPYYMDLGVCHPVVANNTYLLYEKEIGHGLLVEPNPVMAKLIEEYRPRNKLIHVGVTPKENGILPYCSGKRPGLNHFLQEGEAIDRENMEILNIPVLNINQVLCENACQNLDVLDVDIEGMDYEVLNAIDFAQYKIKIICAEYRGVCGTQDMRRMMQAKGYIHWMSTRENHIYLRKEEFERKFYAKCV